MGNSLESNIVCPLCKASSCKIAREVKPYKIFGCKNCKGEFAWPMKSTFDYNKTEESISPDLNRVREKSLRRNFNYAALITFLDSIKRGNILDIGSGPGIFLANASNLGFHGYGVDVSEKAKASRDHFHFKFFKTNGISLDLPQDWPKSFEVVSAVDVLEHVSDPISLGKEAFKILSQEGYFVGSVPNRERYYYAFAKFIDDFVPKECGGDNPPYHLSFWRKNTLGKFLKNTGFDHYYIFSGGLLWRKHIYIKGKYSPLFSRITEKYYQYSPKIPLFLMKFIEKYGSHLIFIAKKGSNGIPIADLEKNIYEKKIPLFVDGGID